MSEMEKLVTNRYVEIIDKGDYQSLTDLLDQQDKEIKSPQEAVQLLCRLQSAVANVKDSYIWPADCFCGETERVGPYRNAGHDIRFIVEATLEKLQNEIASRAS